MKSKALLILFILVAIAIAAFFLFRGDKPKVLSTVSEAIEDQEIGTEEEKAPQVSTESSVQSTLSDIGSVPTSLGKEYTKYFDRHTGIKAPNGKYIHIVAQDNISNEQVLRARNILLHYLEDYPGSKYGSNKDAVMNQMADNNATLALMNGQDDGSNDIKVDAQPLYKNEIQVEGGSWYVNQNYEHRDAAFEEILHLVHDYGIGIDGSNGSNGAAPAFQKEIRAAQKNAQSKNIWPATDNEKGWIKELSRENSLSQEYFASVVDSYYGLWGAYTEEEGGMWGIYVAKDRNEIKSKDPMGYNIMSNAFFRPYLTYNARIDSSFSGTFSLALDNSKPYTHHSQYLKDITLLGGKNTNVKVNNRDNEITGNTGINAVVFSGVSSEYTITKDSVTVVADSIPERDGRNTLKNIEKLQFSDKVISL